MVKAVGVSATRVVTVGAGLNMDYVVLETEDGEGSGSECNSGGDCRRRAGRTDSSSTRFST
jgi:hypothetical protein